jgi:hypothetical protein
VVATVSVADSAVVVEGLNVTSKPHVPVGCRTALHVLFETVKSALPAIVAATVPEATPPLFVTTKGTGSPATVFSCAAKV